LHFIAKEKALCFFVVLECFSRNAGESPRESDLE
jgi:hypothetical protein